MQVKFWLTFGSIITLLGLFGFILVISYYDTLQFHKEYCIFIIPSLIYLLFQTGINYAELTNKN